MRGEEGRDTRKAAGLSLVEALLSMLLLSLVLAGSAPVFAAGLRGFLRLQDGLRVQRTLRMATAALDRDLRMMGYFHPPLPFREGAGETPAWGPPQVAPARPVPLLERGRLRPCGPAEDPWEPSRAAADELSFIQDLPLDAQASLAAPFVPPGCGEEAPPGAGGGICQARLRAGRPVSLEAGDRLVLEDGTLEWVEVAAPVTLRRGEEGEVSLGPPGLRSPHGPGAPVSLLRPLRRVWYRVVFLAPPQASGWIPCLVRFEAPLPEDGGAAACAPCLKHPRVVAEHICGFRVQRVGPEAPGRACRGPWLLRVSLEARSPMARADRGIPGPPAPRHLHRTLTWELIPWNPDA